VKLKKKPDDNNNTTMAEENHDYDNGSERVCLHYCLALLSLMVKDRKGIDLLVRDAERISAVISKIVGYAKEYLSKDMKLRVQQIELWLQFAQKLYHNKLKELTADLAAFTCYTSELQNPLSTEPAQGNGSNIVMEMSNYSTSDISNLIAITSLLEYATYDQQTKLIIFSDSIIPILIEIIARTSKALSVHSPSHQVSPQNSPSGYENKKFNWVMLDSEREREHLFLLYKCLSLLDAVLGPVLKPAFCNSPVAQTPFRSTPLLNILLKLHTIIANMPTYTCQTLGSLNTNMVQGISALIIGIFSKWTDTESGSLSFSNHETCIQ